MYHVGGANTTHCILAIIYYIFTQCSREDAEKLITFGGKFPWFKKGKDTVPENIKDCSKKLFDYFLALEKAAEKMPKLIEDCIDLAKKAIDLKDKAIPEINKADDLTKAKATKSVAHNVKMLLRAKNVAKSTADMIAKVSKELKEAYDIIKEQHSQLHEYGRTCADADLKSPLQCYQRVGPKLTSKATKTEEEMVEFPYEAEKEKGDKDEEEGDKDEEEKSSD